jgi:hypothetical protein
MKQQIKTPFSEKLNYIIILIFCFGTPFFILTQFGYDDRQESITIIFISLFSLGIYAIFKIYQNSKSVFLYCEIENANKKIIINKLVEEKNFKTLPSFNSDIIRMYYKKYALGLDYEIHFYIHENQIEFNAFCNRLGILDFGTRKRILKSVKDKIESSCACL